MQRLFFCKGVQITSQLLTLEEFLKLPETKPASEYMDGEIIQKRILQGKHSTIPDRQPEVF